LKKHVDDSAEDQNDVNYVDAAVVVVAAAAAAAAAAAEENCGDDPSM